ncbi:type II toxin-antitoxin system PemK/MazF family toxin [Nodularia spumigena]|uniref:type II toxin-antitoxin system PemK/MazF family toxin n=1 Tax=Nodularia spumigena TaxID=70799 RepID=UPI00232AFA47|nr:type II toxin-antitoxin system PemK/MazF family toxin [Nodularia spumigena]MDB9317343.1 type II toxin-antitoxin system PemK/MazF family toxin [Nodularia spumigena CS-590/01A]MDB9325902.1 type II toxin-antitoxin system PemK/MazF family toxin [Nodularia spumigena CS-590/02]MDB9335128.1 type II toxin-antitoxin system PemK/MazF family toxin [Nodularia spumigena CS-590/01]
MTINPDLPKRGEIWLVNFDPTVGAEIKKVRPAVVISSDSVGKLPIKLIADKDKKIMSNEKERISILMFMS